MKNAVLFLFVLLCANIYAQKGNQIETGVYTSNKTGGEFIFKINEDKTYEMVFFYGDYTIKNDTIHFNNQNKDKSNFLLKTTLGESEQFTIKFKDPISSYNSSKVFIGTQENENELVIYKPITDYLKLDDYSENAIKEFTIDKTKYFYLVETNAEQSKISKYEIANNVSAIEVEYVPYSLSDIKLKGYIDPVSKSLVITDGKVPMLFELEKESTQKASATLKSIETINDKSFFSKFGNLGLSNDVEPNSQEENYDKENDNVATFKFKHTINKTLNEALKNTKNSKSKFLVVAFDTQNKKAQSDFDTFIKSSEITMDSYMYGTYYEEYDKFNFYLASDKDKKILTDNKINSKQEILVLNADGSLVYHTSGTLSDKAALFSAYDNVYEELSKANAYLEFDKVILDKKATAIQSKSAFKKALKIQFSNYGDEVVAPVAIDDFTKTPSDTIAQDVVVDAYDTSYYDKIKDKKNLYSLKATPVIVDLKWKQVVASFKKTNLYDKEYVAIIKAELSNEGFNQKLFNKVDASLNDTNLDLLDYVFINYETIAQLAISDTTNVEDDYFEEKTIKTVLDNYFYNFTVAAFAENQQSELKRGIEYYKKYISLSGYSNSAVQSYLTMLSKNIASEENQKEYFVTYETYFNSIIKDNLSIIENLDAAYTKIEPSDYTTWPSFKTNFSNLANEVSWLVVEKITDKNIIEKAVKWSQISLYIEKNNHYYLDTLAQLYYKNGQREKAILTEEKAIEFGADTENIMEYKATLEKMKNGTY